MNSADVSAFEVEFVLDSSSKESMGLSFRFARRSQLTEMIVCYYYSKKLINENRRLEQTKRLNHRKYSICEYDQFYMKL